MSEDEVRLVESRIGDMLAARGYQLSGHPRLDVTPAMARRLRRQDRIGRVRFRINRFGLKLYAADVISRRIGTKAWRKSVKLRMNEVVNEHLK
jgi:hypothetical protein